MTERGEGERKTRKSETVGLSLWSRILHLSLSPAFRLFSSSSRPLDGSCPRGACCRFDDPPF